MQFLSHLLNRLLSREKWSLSAHEFEKASGIGGISRDYVMPDYFSMAEIGMKAHNDQAKLQRKYNTKTLASLVKHFSATAAPDDYSEFATSLRKTAQELIHLNPELKAVRFNEQNILDVYHFVKGVASGYNPADINYWMQIYADDQRRHDAAKTKNELGGVIGIRIKWLPAPETLEYIEAHRS